MDSEAKFTLRLKRSMVRELRTIAVTRDFGSIQKLVVHILEEFLRKEGAFDATVLLEEERLALKQTLDVLRRGSEAARGALKMTLQLASSVRSADEKSENR